jgi:hypothetical protein
MATSMADLTVKKADETTNIVYAAKAASAGDRVPAIWKSTTVGTAPAHNPTLAVTARSNADGKVRRMEFTYTYPQTAVSPADGSISVVNLFQGSGSFAIPQGMPQTDLNEAVAQCFNCLAATLVKTAFKDGYAPT